MSGHHKIPEGEKARWLDRKENVEKIWWALVAVCVGLLVVDFFVPKHPYFDIENVPNFYGFYGFVGCVFLVLAAAQLRKLIMRKEDYYEDKDAAMEARVMGDDDEEGRAS